MGKAKTGKNWLTYQEVHKPDIPLCADHKDALLFRQAYGDVFLEGRWRCSQLIS